MDIDLNECFCKALEIMESDRNVFITGKAGTGKSTLLSYFRAHTTKKIITLAGYNVHLVTTNLAAEAINSEHLAGLKTAIHTYCAETLGEFRKESYPTNEELQLAVGAQVMLLNNDSKGRWVNGSIGRIKEIIKKSQDSDVILVELADGRVVEVIPFTWEIFHFEYNNKHKIIETETVGSFTQYPLKLAWAITIHKSQGKTFDRVIIGYGGCLCPWANVCSPEPVYLIGRNSLEKTNQKVTYFHGLENRKIPDRVSIRA